MDRHSHIYILCLKKIILPSLITYIKQGPIHPYTEFSCIFLIFFPLMSCCLYMLTPVGKKQKPYSSQMAFL